MKKLKSEFLSALGVAFEIWKKIVNAVLALGGDDSDLRRILTEPGLAEKIAQVIMASKKAVRKWREENGVIYLTVVSDGTTGEEWIARLESKGFRVSDYAKSVLRSKDFKPTSGIAYEIAVLKGTAIKDNDRVTSNIRAEAESRGWANPNAEIACLVREFLTDEDIEAMGLYWLVIMHKPIKDSGGDPILLYANRDGNGRWLDTDYGRSGNWWLQGSGFLFSVPQVSPSFSLISSPLVL